MTKRQQRMLAVGLLGLGLAVAASLGLTAFRKNLMYFYAPSDVLAAESAPSGRIRLGGLVEAGSVKRGQGLEVAFVLADCEHRLPVRYEGILPDLFREGQGIVASGAMDDGGVFVADEVLAKHDENYMPPELAESLTTDTGHSCAPFKSVNS
ncbi:MAG: cytochrome c maturation protein CcmE [Panacagrimonas sp.]